MSITAKRLKTLRKEKNLLQEDVANAIGVTKMTISRWESGKSLPRFENIDKLADFFEVSGAYVMAMDLRPYNPIDFVLESESELLKFTEEEILNLKQKGFEKGDKAYDEEFSFLLYQKNHVDGLSNAQKILEILPYNFDFNELIKFLSIFGKLNRPNQNEVVNFTKYQLSVQQLELSRNDRKAATSID